MPKKRATGSRKPSKTVRVLQPLSSYQSHNSGRLPWLMVVHGAEVDLGHHMVCDRPIVIGRDLDVDLPLHDASISRSHCRITPVENGFELQDLDSTNGTRLNERRIGTAQLLKEGDKFFIGESVIRFSYADSVDREYHERREEMVSKDALTGMSAKRVYDARYNNMVACATADETLLSVMVMDMDGLKQINDNHGHEMGGFAISEVATIIREQLEQHGHLCRFGGDEFVGAFSGIPREEAIALAEGVRARVAEHTYAHNDVSIEPTLSIGVATYPDDVPHPKQLFSAADQALYRAKRAGRNRVECAIDWQESEITKPGEFHPDD